jgi:hypothetical protein
VVKKQGINTPRLRKTNEPAGILSQVGIIMLRKTILIKDCAGNDQGREAFAWNTNDTGRLNEAKAEVNFSVVCCNF